MNAELLSYSRNKGLFAGIDLDGTSVTQNKEDTETYYGTAAQLREHPARATCRARGRSPFVRTVAHDFVSASANKSRSSSPPPPSAAR